MIPSYIPIRSSILTIAMMISAHAQTDTVVLNSTEFRFPETQPGRVFVVKKIVVNGQQALKKGVEAGNPATTAPLAAPSLAAAADKPTRDVMGRILKSGEYAKRMANIQKAHKLPTVAARGQMGDGERRRIIRGQGVGFHKSAGARYALISNSPLIQNSQDLVRLEKAEREAVRKKYGALSPELIRKLERSNNGELLEVLVQLKSDHPGFVDGSKVSLEARKVNAQAWARATSKIDPVAFAQRKGVQAKEFTKAGSFKTALPRARLQELAHDENIAAISEVRPPVQNAIDRGHPVHYQSLIDAAYNPPTGMMNYGGLNVATLESGITHRYVNSIAPSLRPVYYDTALDNGDAAHAEGMFHLLSLGTPGSNRFHLNPGLSGIIFRTATNSIVNNDIEVISTSWANGWWTEIDPDSRVIDRFSYIYPYPVIVLSGGNAGHSLETISRTYNSLIAGNVQHYDDATYTVDFVAGGNITNASQSKNPPAKYFAGDDWELPTLVAPGYSPDPWWGVFDSNVLSNPWTGTVWVSGGGTSLSAPVLAAMAANVRGAFGNSGHPSAPMETKAALLVTAENVDGYEASEWTDERDGFGTVSGKNAVAFAETTAPASIGGPAYIDGIASGTMDSLDFANFIPRTYNFKIPSTFPTGKHLRIVLTWTSSPGSLLNDNELSDLALEATTDNWTWWSSRQNGNIETMNFEQPSNNFSPNGEYQITIYPWEYRTAWDGPRHLHYALAWTWVKSHAD